jgi:hypothetical protein
MPILVRCIIAVLLLATMYPTADAQERASPRKVSPRMSADGVQAPLTVDGSSPDDSKMRSSSGLSRRSEPAVIRWARYTLPGTTLSLELPSEPYNLPNRPGTELPEGVSVGHFGSTGRRMSIFMTYAHMQAAQDAREYAVAALDTLITHKRVSDCNSTFDRSMASLRVPVRITCQADGVDMELTGIVFFANDHRRVLVVLGFFATDNPQARASALRAVNSVRISQ